MIKIGTITWYAISMILYISLCSFEVPGCDTAQVGLKAKSRFASGLYLKKYGPTFEVAGGGVIRGVAVGDSGTIVTSTGRPGLAWVDQISGTNEDLNDVRLWQQTDTGVVFAVGNRGTLLRSENFGETWATMNSGSTNNLYGYDYVDHYTAIIVGDSGTILSAGDVGDPVQHFNSGTTRRLTSIVVNDAYIFIVVGEKGTILRTTNSGQTWEDHSLTDTTINFNRIARYGYIGYGGRIWVMGDHGKVYRSFDGTIWTEQNSGTGAKLNDAFFSNATTGGVVGDGGLIRYTTDGGSNWISNPYLDSLTSQDIRALVRIDDSTYSVLTVGGVFTVSSNPLTAIAAARTLPKKSSLEQNFPNPFNPTTTIRFDLAEAGFVSLKVYDILGHEVATLVNERLHPGSYERTFDSQELTSGVYFYKLAAGNFVDVKKFLFIR